MARNASNFSSVNFSINYFLPFVRGGNYQGNLNISAQNWTHTIAAFGGFDRAEFILLDTPEIISDWVEDGIGRVIQAHDETGVVMWEGFVNRIMVQQSGFELSIGPLTDIVNRAKLIYSTFDTTTSPAFEGIRKETLINNNLQSQLRYGIFYKALSAAGVSDGNAVQLRDMYLSQHAWPETSSNFSPESGSQEMRVECLGFIHMQDFPYNRLVSSGTVSISTKIGQILTADPNVLFTDLSGIRPNVAAVPAWEDENRSALGLLKSLTAIGDLSLNRWILGAYENRRIEYAPVDNTQPEYFIALADPSLTIYDRLHAEIKPWQVRPGKWVMFTDFLPAFTPEGGDFNLDPRALFIEEVTFRLPFGAEFNGGKTLKINQKLAQLGLAGIST